MSRLVQRVLLPVAVLASLASCATAAPSNTARVLLNTRYVTGGDGPLVESLIVFDDGAICLKTIGRRPQWKRLSPADRKRIAALTADAATIEAVAALPHAPACCDAAEVAISLASTAAGRELPSDAPRASLVSIASLPRPVVTLLEERDRVGRAYFGRPYLNVLPPVQANTACLHNRDIQWDGTFLGVQPAPTSECAKQLQAMGKRAVPALRAALDDPERYVAAHVLLTLALGGKHGSTGSEFNGLNVQIYANSQVVIPDQQREIQELWRERP